ncbi:MAG: tyrosine-type recombinase/integrase [Dehalococcoidia bacterium]
MARPHRVDRGLFPYRLRDGTLQYGVRLYRRGIAHKWSGFTRKQDARVWYEDRRRDVRDGRPFPGRSDPSNTVAGMIEHYLAQTANKKSHSIELAYAAFWGQWLGSACITDPLAERIDRARTQLLTQGHTRGPLAHATVNRYVAWLHHLFQDAWKKGLVVRNPCSGLKFKEANAPEVEFTEAEEAAIAKALGDQADYPTLAILTGLRQGEQFSLAWDDLDVPRGIGKLHDPKGGNPEIFMINAGAAEIFRRLRVQAGESKWVFPSRRDHSRHLHPKSWYNHVFKPACAAAGIVLSRKQGKTYHTLRHTFASRLQQAGVEVKDLKDLGRWKSWKAMDRYLKRDVSRLRSAIERLGVPHGTAHEPPIKQKAEL